MRWAHSTFSDISIYKAQNLRITPSIAFYIRPKNTPTHTASSERKAEKRREEKKKKTEPFSRFPFWQHSLWCDSVKVKYNFAFLCRRLYIEFDLEGLLPLQSTTVLRLHTLPGCHTPPRLHFGLPRHGRHSRQMESFQADIATQCILNEPQTRCAFIFPPPHKKVRGISHVVPDNLNQ